jgi:hypothetical protein
LVATQPDFKAEAVWKGWGHMYSWARYLFTLKAGLPKAIGETEQSRAGVGANHGSDSCDQVSRDHGGELLAEVVGIC